MNNNRDISFEDDLFEDKMNDATKDLQNNIIQREMEDLENFEDNINIKKDKQKMEIIPTNIVCDGSGFQNLIEKDDTSEPSPDFSKYKFNNFRVSDNEYLIVTLPEN